MAPLELAIGLPAKPRSPKERNLLKTASLKSRPKKPTKKANKKSQQKSVH